MLILAFPYSIPLIGIQTLLFNLNCMGLLSFNEVKYGITLLTLATAYLPSGFFGGLYTGYRIKDSLRSILIFPALVGFTVFIVFLLLFGYGDFLNLLLQEDILIALLGIVAGSYFGGYTINWKRGEVDESPETD